MGLVTLLIEGGSGIFRNDKRIICGRRIMLWLFFSRFFCLHFSHVFIGIPPVWFYLVVILMVRFVYVLSLSCCGLLMV